MPIVVPVAGQEVNAAAFGAPVANYLNDLDAAWISFVPTISGGGTVGAGVQAGKYKKIGAKTALVTMFWSWGAGAYGGSGEYRWTLPFNHGPGIYDYQTIGVAHCSFNTGARKICTVHKIGANGVVIFGDWGSLGATAPQTVAVNDGYYMSFTCEIA